MKFTDAIAVSPSHADLSAVYRLLTQVPFATLKQIDGFVHFSTALKVIDELRIYRGVEIGVKPVLVPVKGGKFWKIEDAFFLAEGSKEREPNESIGDLFDDE